jgi:hypothetical protein
MLLTAAACPDALLLPLCDSVLPVCEELEELLGLVLLPVWEEVPVCEELLGLVLVPVWELVCELCELL